MKNLHSLLPPYQESINAVVKDIPVSLKPSIKPRCPECVYELQLKETDQHIKEISRSSENWVHDEKLKESVEEPKKYREEMARLSENIATLNNITATCFLP
jgi:hypothetical protein